MALYKPMYVETFKEYLEELKNRAEEIIGDITDVRCIHISFDIVPVLVTDLEVRKEYTITKYINK